FGHPDRKEMDPALMEDGNPPQGPELFVLPFGLPSSYNLPANRRSGMTYNSTSPRSCLGTSRPFGTLSLTKRSRILSRPSSLARHLPLKVSRRSHRSHCFVSPVETLGPSREL